LVVARDGDQHLGALDARALHDPQLGAVAVLGLMLELLLYGGEARRVGLDQRDLVTLGAELAPEVESDLPGADDDHVHQLISATSPFSPTASSSMSIAFCVGHTVDRPWSSYHCARIGSSTRTTTFSMLKRRFAICAITRFV